MTTCGEPVMRNNWLLTGTKVKNHKLMQVKSADACWKICQKNPECNFIVWRKRYKKCTRLATKTKGVKKNGYISGLLSNCD